MNKTKEKGRGLNGARKALFGVVAFAAAGIFLLAACENSMTAANSEEAAPMELLSEVSIAGNSRRAEGRSLLREDFIRWAEERGYSGEDLSSRSVWREYRQTEEGKQWRGEYKRHRPGRDSKGENRIERRARTGKELLTKI